MANIPLTQWRYDHKALTFIIAHERPHGGRACQIFYNDGPLAILPLNDDISNGQAVHHSSIVWSMSPDRADNMQQLSDKALAAEVKRHMGGYLGDVTISSNRLCYPLGYHQAAHMVDERLALIGDAAHIIHPMAGQGFNLAIRDAEALADTMNNALHIGLDAGNLQILERYQRIRATDIAALSISTDGLYRIFGIKGKMAAKLRQRGMAMVNRSSLLKNMAMAVAQGN